VRGWTRAGALVELFAPGAGTICPGLARPTAVYAAGGTGSEASGPDKKVTPLATRLGLSVDTTYAKGGETTLAQQIASRPGSTLVCWQHDEIPSIAAALGTPPPPTTWPGNLFDLVWILAPPHTAGPSPTATAPNPSPDTTPHRHSGLVRPKRAFSVRVIVALAEFPPRSGDPGTRAHPPRANGGGAPCSL
jgi:hypothetical protein